MIMHDECMMYGIYILHSSRLRVLSQADPYTHKGKIIMFAYIYNW